MGGELLTTPDESNLVTYTEVFEEHEPFYISIGMPRNEYWDGEAQLTKVYRNAFEMKRDRKNHELWLQGLYIYEALIDASPVFHDLVKGKVKPIEYVKEPYPITQKQVKEKAEREERLRAEKQKAMVEAWAKRVNSQIKDNNNGRKTD